MVVAPWGSIHAGTLVTELELEIRPPHLWTASSASGLPF